MKLFAAILVALALAAPALAEEPHPTLAQLEHEVMCPTCHTLLELSHAPIAERMRAFIRRRISAGDTDREIKAKLVAEFGEGVLAAPPASGFGLLAWVLPLGGVGGGAAIVAVVVRERSRQPAPSPVADAALERRLDDALDRFDYS